MGQSLPLRVQSVMEAQVTFMEVGVMSAEETAGAFIMPGVASVRTSVIVEKTP